MRHIILLFLAFSTFATYAEEPAGLNSFAEEYWSAIKSKEPQKIFSLYDPRIFEQLSPDEITFIKDTWMASYIRIADKQGDSYEIRVKSLSAEDDPIPGWRWAAKPEFQIEIQTFKNVAIGKEGLSGLAELVIQRSGKFFIMRPVPPTEQLEKRMKKKNG